VASRTSKSHAPALAEFWWKIALFSITLQRTIDEGNARDLLGSF